MNTALMDKDCFVSTITLAAIRALGPQSLDWEPQILRDAAAEALDIKISQRLFDKLNCGYSLIGTNMYTQAVEGFLACNAVMSGDVLQGDQVAYNDMQDIAWGVWEYMNLVGEMENGRPLEPFSADIQMYIQKLASTQGISQLPAWLSFAQPTQKQLEKVGLALAADPMSFEMYQRRQQAAIADITAFVADRQQKLIEQLKIALNGLKTA